MGRRRARGAPDASAPTLAFAGAGRITIVHGLAAQALGLTVTAVASRRTDHARERAGQLGAQVVTYDALPAGARIEVVATPPARHAADALQALRAGAVAMVEKPLCTTLAEADALVDATSEGGRLLYAENLAFAPVVREALAMAATLGPLRYIEARALQGRPDWGDFLTAEWGGGALFDLGVHPLAVVLLLAGEPPLEVSARLDGSPDIAVDDHAEVDLRFPSGLQARLVSSWRAPDAVWDLQAASDDGVVRAELIPTLSLERDGEAVPLPMPRPGIEVVELDRFGYLAQLEAVVALSANGSPPRMSADFGRAVLDVVCAAYRSAGRDGQPEPLPFTGARDATPLALWKGSSRGA